MLNKKLLLTAPIRNFPNTHSRPVKIFRTMFFLLDIRGLNRCSSGRLQRCLLLMVRVVRYSLFCRCRCSYGKVPGFVCFQHTYVFIFNGCFKKPRSRFRLINHSLIKLRGAFVSQNIRTLVISRFGLVFKAFEKLVCGNV